MQILSLKISNILSVKSAELTFGNSGLVLLDGWNYDDNTANGAGKSALFNAMAFGLYGKMPRNVSASDYLRRGTKQGFVHVSINNGTDVWAIKRERPNSVSIWKNGQLELISQEEFESKLGLSYGQFLLTLYASQLKTEKFILLNDSGKKDFLLQLMNLDRFAELRLSATTQLKEIETKIQKFENTAFSLEGKLSTLRESIVDPQTIQQQIEQCDATTLIREINELSNITEPDMTQFRQIEAGISQKRRALDTLRVEANTLRRERDGLLRQQRSKADVPSTDCPHCQEKLIITGRTLVRATDIVERNRLIDEQNQEFENQAAVLAAQINDLESRLLGSRDLDILEQRIRDKQIEKTADYRKATARISELRSVKARLENQAGFLRQKLNEIQGIQDKIAVTQADIEKVGAATEKLKSERTLVETLSAIFGPTGAPAYVSDMVIDRLNERIADYMTQIWPAVTYQILSYKENKSGEIRAKFSEKITKSGTEWSLGALSGGELRCISLVVDLAIIEVVDSLFGISLNPLILDEPFDGMDVANRERAIELLSKLSKNKEIWIIDHSSEARAMFSQIVRVEKRAEITSVV